MVDRKIGCRAKPHSDQMYCNRCEVIWDTNDPDPPECKSKNWRSKQIAVEAIAQMKRKFTNEQICD